ncbi:glutamyl-tRNA reductase [Microlunatus endophyticus]|uniref:Glutamyl-tRNA reductase n=1 Tax=Microlunatus endophyticus TaxID=1716077 RepID=A0A917S6T1_9ACTN|nr:glutamyl-tRNA reductase [Microlunatus endophyticus]GGL58854.1 glutamyl-tRNA reductase [Microlunatus endophyticus]
MSILVVSVSHKTTSIDVLGRLSMDPDTAAKLGESLSRSEHIDEAVVLSTCNRTEVYAEVARFHAGLDEITGQLAEATGTETTLLRGICSVYFDEGAVAHTFNVSGGLDSMVIGENQILGQVRTALTGAQQIGTVGTVLNSLFQQGIRVGKRVQTETAIGGAGRSMMTAALRHYQSMIGSLEGARVAVVGAGSMASLAARTVAAHGAQVTAVNRTYDRAVRLAEAIGGQARPLAGLGEVLSGSDLVITCTGARDLVLTADQVVGTPVVAVIDLALPADADPAIADLVPLINLDRLLHAGDDTVSTADVDAARELVRLEVHDFLARRRASQVTPTVVALRSMAAEVTESELHRLDGRLPELDERQRAEIAKTVRRVVDKLLHQPTVRVQEFAANQGQVDYAAALRELFALDPQTVVAVMSPETTAAPEPTEGPELVDGQITSTGPTR